MAGIVAAIQLLSETSSTDVIGYRRKIIGLGGLNSRSTTAEVPTGIAVPCDLKSRANYEPTRRVQTDERHPL